MEFEQTNEFIHLSKYPVFLHVSPRFHTSLKITPPGNKKNLFTVNFSVFREAILCLKFSKLLNDLPAEEKKDLNITPA